MGGKWKEFHFCKDVEDFLKQKKSASTQYTYRGALAKFQDYYQGKHGKDKTIADFLDAVDQNRQKPRRQQKRLAETVLNGYIEYLEKDGKVPILW